MSVTDEQKINILSQDLLVYISHLEESYNRIEESEEKIIVQVDRIYICNNNNLKKNLKKAYLM